jgi:hypothetical protein
MPLTKMKNTREKAFSLGYKGKEGDGRRNKDN